MLLPSALGVFEEALQPRTCDVVAGEGGELGRGGVSLQSVGIFVRDEAEADEGACGG